MPPLNHKALADWRIRRCLSILARLHRTREITSPRRRATVREYLLNTLEETLLDVCENHCHTEVDITSRIAANDP